MFLSKNDIAHFFPDLGGWGEYRGQFCSELDKIINKLVLEPQVSPENTSKYVDTVTVFAKT